MFIASHTQLGESANDLVAKFGRSGYRYGFPDFYAAEFPARPMNYDASRIYSGVIGKHYPDAQTYRYHYLYDPNMYQQPGVPAGFGDAGTMSAPQAIAVLQGLLASAPAGAYLDFDVTYANNSATGSGIDVANKLWVIQGKTFEQVRYAIAAAGGITTLNTAGLALRMRIAKARASSDPDIVSGTFGTVDDVRAAVENMIDVLKSGAAIPVAVTPITAVKASERLATPKQFAIAGATVGVALLGVVGAVLLTR